MDEQAKVALRKQHGALAEFTVAGVFLAFKRPSLEEWDANKKKLRSDKHSKSAAMRELCQQTLVVPSVEEFAAVIAKKPATPAVVIKKLQILAGADLQAVIHDDDTATLTLDDGRSWTFRSPEFEAWEDCQEQLATGKNEQEVIWRELALRCAVDKTGLETLFAEQPAAQETLGNVLATLAGGAIQGEVKKG